MAEDIIKAIHEVPPAIAAMLEMCFGTVAEVTSPGTVEESLIIQGKVAANFNNAILKPLSGLPLVELALRIGQNNPSTQGMLLSMLKITGSLGKDAVTCNLKEGGTYPVGKLPITVSVSGGSASAVSGAFSGPENDDFDFDKSGEGKDWQAEPEIKAAGDYTIDIAVELEERKELSFHVSITDAPAQPEQPEEGA